MPTGIYPRTLEHNLKIKIANTGKKRSPETRLRLSRSKLGNTNGFKKGNLYRSSGNTGHHHSAEVRQKISEARKGKAAGPACHLWRGGIHTYERRLFINQRRRALKAHAGGSHSQAEWNLIKKLFGDTCPSCRRSEPVVRLTEDHIVPLASGGSDYIWNIQPLCLHCNVVKHTKVIEYQPA